ncbi:MAG TPA: hypothetical protein ENN98_06210 [Desulfurivibrio alkaliphilus]|uniref:Aminoglycoside phosphotransferase domain-containing protein n=1 Tax=Desulfurivibrio alkaliphilus TaxID=427923 RepID=A0A7C2XRT9_9BACT|nr:hypothetical protein [Desulfurivibrio alkaliphilus]
MSADLQGQLPETVSFLLNPAVYPHPVAKVELLQTHISYVLLAGDFVYKLKKPVNFGFLDFSTLERRRHFCAEELRLNRRLCPEIYLETLSLNRDGAGRFSLNGAGEPVEYLIKMVRMPEAGMMSGLLEQGRVEVKHLEQIIAKLVPFYQQADGGPEVTALGAAEAVAVNVLENFEQTEGFVGCSALSREQFEQISAYAREFLQQEELFAARQRAGRIREGHGDLYSANICFGQQQVYIFDCIEFNQRFRCCDIASDIAFLAMDLDLHGREDLSAYLVEEFARRSADPELLTMLRFYTCYRAYVRGKIGLFTAHAPEVDAATKERSLALAARYFQLAARYARS